GWSCVTYDARGRVLSQTFPAWDGQATRTVNYNHAVGGNPLVSSIGDPAGTITTTVDLLGRVLSYSDVWGQVTTSTYDTPGRLVTSRGPFGRVDTDYDAAGRVTGQFWTDDLNGAKATTPLATPFYDDSANPGMLARADYANGTNLGSATSFVGRDEAGRPTRLEWSGPAGTLATDEVHYSRAGRVDDQRIDGVDAYVGTGGFGTAGSQNFLYDGVGRLVTARIAGHELGYDYTTVVAGCTLFPNAGKTTNRNRLTDNGALVATYCYNQADRLVSTTDPAVGAIAYDARGNTKTLGTQTLTWDGADRHMAAAVAGGPTVTYKRDATGRIVERTETGQATVRYGSSGPGDTPAFTMTTANAVI
ncbi:MAG: hypothetical protein LC708_01695, partial [Actinobacteria bacterium]|nr:hypothetical protein [Actinomycetota bacterium]